jgi:membrane protease YdiL (CAAX protease family)
MVSRFLKTVRHSVDRSPLGVGLAGSAAVRWLLAVPALFLLVRFGWQYVHRLPWPEPAEKWLVMLTCVAFVLLVARGQRIPLGLTIRPVQGWSPWLRYTAVAGGVIALLGVPVGVALYHGGALDIGPRYDSLSLADVAYLFLDSVVETPVYEELMARLICLAALVPLLGRWGAFLTSAVLFGLWHWYNPGPTNLIAGLAFGWAYLASGSLVVPILWHALGNLSVLIVDVLQCWSAPVS